MVVSCRKVSNNLRNCQKNGRLFCADVVKSPFDGWRELTFIERVDTIQMPVRLHKARLWNQCFDMGSIIVLFQTSFVSFKMIL